VSCYSAPWQGSEVLWWACLLAYLENHTSRLHQILHSCHRSHLGAAAICYALSVFQRTPSFHVMGPVKVFLYRRSSHCSATHARTYTPAAWPTLRPELDDGVRQTSPSYNRGECRGGVCDAPLPCRSSVVFLRRSIYR